MSVFGLSIPLLACALYAEGNGKEVPHAQTGKKYVFAGFPSPKDSIVACAERLMKPLKKYGTSEEGYDFSKARTSKQSILRDKLGEYYIITK